MKHFYLRDEKRNPIGCVSSRLIMNGGWVEFAVSTHNPIDKFSKVIAKEVAMGRLGTSQAQMIHMQPKIKWQIMKMIAFDKSLPMKTRRAATLWLNESNNYHREESEEGAQFD